MEPGRQKASMRAFFVLAILAGLPALATAQYDVPTVTPIKIDRSSITLRITAGASGAPAGFEVEWMTRADYDLLGGWPHYGEPVLVECGFTGQPTLTVTPSGGSYVLGPGASIDVEIGDLFDETGVYTYYTDELPPGTEIVFRVYANGYGPFPSSAYSPTLFASTDPVGDGCVLTQGFWKTHPETWPVVSLRLGTVVYTAAQLFSILTTPAQGNGLIFLAHQLIAAKLNILNGAPLATIAASIAAADALINGLVIPPIGVGFLQPSQASALTEALDEFNNGETGVPECGPVSVDNTTWSDFKSKYRDRE